ncbi:MAG TPA: bifunctional 3-(3-hydroxy-phenyl)propionate/3-hydroxycinnamic acid hydroxylase [Rhodopila sp.]|nr:bifunctional 3-(3-hydroxy-phenyl)propionate/3-hydroxycinnamic acid hydroxylase [Rhodopila sp.]
MRADADVAVVGYGPTGAALANLLALAGASVVVLEREAATYHLPRAVHFDDDVMRVLQTIGVADAMAEQTHVNPGMRFVDAAGTLLIDWPRPPEIGPQGWHASYRFHQPTLERVLRDAAARQNRIAVHARCDVFAIDEQEDGVRLRFEDLAAGRLRTLTARYVVGCDGARSTVRRFMGVEHEDLQCHEPWLVIDAILKRPRPDLGDHSVQYCDPVRPATYVRGVGQRRRWEIMLRPDEDGAAMSRPDTVWALLSRWITAEDATLERAVPYVFHAVLARQWRRGRLLLAGDSAHQTPPFLGQGLCAGVRDAANLAWKLAAVCRGAAADSLLDSYELERSPHVRAYIELAVELGRVIMHHADPGNRNGQPVKLESIRPRLGTYQDRPEPEGRPAPQPRLADGTRLDDRIGYRHALLRRPGTPPAAIQRGLGGELVDVADAALTPWLDAIGVEAVLMRPDRNVERAGTLTYCAMGIDGMTGGIN